MGQPIPGTDNITRCIPYATQYNTAAPGADTDFLTDFTVGSLVSALRITICLSTSSVLNLAVTDGTTAHAMALNGGTALTANALYTFTVGARRTKDGTEDGTQLVYNLQVATDSVIEYVMVEGVTGGLL